MTVIRFSRGRAAQICGPGDEFKRIIKDVMLGQLCFYGGNLGVLSCRYNAGHARGYQHLAFARAEFGAFLLGRQNGLTTNQLFPAPGTTKSFVLYRKSAKKLMPNQASKLALKDAIKYHLRFEAYWRVVGILYFLLCYQVNPICSFSVANFEMNVKNHYYLNLDILLSPSFQKQGQPF